MQRKKISACSSASRWWCSSWFRGWSGTSRDPSPTPGAPINATRGSTYTQPRADWSETTRPVPLIGAALRAQRFCAARGSLSPRHGQTNDRPFLFTPLRSLSLLIPCSQRAYTYSAPKNGLVSALSTSPPAAASAAGSTASRGMKSAAPSGSRCVGGLWCASKGKSFGKGRGEKVRMGDLGTEGCRPGRSLLWKATPPPHPLKTSEQHAIILKQSKPKPPRRAPTSRTPNPHRSTPPARARTWKPTASKNSTAPGTTATRAWNAALPRLMRRNFSSSGARATLPFI